MSSLNTYPLTWSDGEGTTTLGIFLPSSYEPGTPLPWVQCIHGGGGDYTQYLGNALMQDLAESYGFALVGASWGSSYYYRDVGGVATPTNHAQDVNAAAIALVPELAAYLPCLLGVSMGGGATADQFNVAAQKYSAFAAEAPMVDRLTWRPTEWAADATAYGHPGATYPSGFQPLDELYRRDSPTLDVATASHHGRKIWTWQGQADAAIDYTTIHLPYVARIPAENLEAAETTVGGVHGSAIMSYGYGDEVFSFFTDAATLASAPLTFDLGLDLFDVYAAAATTAAASQSAAAASVRASSSVAWPVTSAQSAAASVLASAGATWLAASAFAAAFGVKATAGGMRADATSGVIVSAVVYGAPVLDTFPSLRASTAAFVARAHTSTSVRRMSARED